MAIIDIDQIIFKYLGHMCPCGDYNIKCKIYLYSLDEGPGDYLGTIITKDNICGKSSGTLQNIYVKIRLVSAQEGSKWRKS